MAARLLALLAAVAMVTGAIAVRNRVGDDNGGGGGSGSLHLVCASELATVCDALDHGDVEVTIEPAAVTADRLHGAKADTNDIDGWLAPGPWGEMVDTARAPSAGKLFAAPGAALARSPLVLAVWKDKRSRLGCADPVDAGCIGDAVIARGLRLGTPADDQATGVLVDAALGAGHIKNPNFATNDLDETDVADWLSAVDLKADGVGRNPGGRSFTELLSFGEASADGYLSTEAEIGPQLAGAARRGQLDVVNVTPAATADVLFFPRIGARGGRLAGIVRTDRVRELLRAAGWRLTGLAPDDGLPSAGVLQAIREVTK
jgi:hypothetical protein